MKLIIYTIEYYNLLAFVINHPKMKSSLVRLTETMEDYNSCGL